mmetsp:Transcript_1927/g.5849  ORF Transcript_1927/g.5849 Transcript_1927/m.5849 type:complete len:296 (+) Transcript_1927:92-979(+)
MSQLVPVFRGRALPAALRFAVARTKGVAERRRAELLAGLRGGQRGGQRVDGLREVVAVDVRLDGAASSRDHRVLHHERVVLCARLLLRRGLLGQGLEPPPLLAGRPPPLPDSVPLPPQGRVAGVLRLILGVVVPGRDPDAEGSGDGGEGLLVAERLSRSRLDEGLLAHGAADAAPEVLCAGSRLLQLRGLEHRLWRLSFELHQAGDGAVRVVLLEQLVHARHALPLPARATPLLASLLASLAAPLLCPAAAAAAAAAAVCARLALWADGRRDVIAEVGRDLICGEPCGGARVHCA